MGVSVRASARAHARTSARACVSECKSSSGASVKRVRASLDIMQERVCIAHAGASV